MLWRGVGGGNSGRATEHRHGWSEHDGEEGWWGYCPMPPWWNLHRPRNLQFHHRRDRVMKLSHGACRQFREHAPPLGGKTHHRWASESLQAEMSTISYVSEQKQGVRFTCLNFNSRERSTRAGYPAVTAQSRNLDPMTFHPLAPTGSSSSMRSKRV